MSRRSASSRSPCPLPLGSAPAAATSAKSRTGLLVYCVGYRRNSALASSAARRARPGSGPLPARGPRWTSRGRRRRRLRRCRRHPVAPCDDPPGRPEPAYPGDGACTDPVSSSGRGGRPTPPRPARSWTRPASRCRSVPYDGRQALTANRRPSRRPRAQSGDFAPVHHSSPARPGSTSVPSALPTR